MNKFTSILALAATLAIGTAVYAAMPTTAVICDQAKKEMVSGNIKPNDSLHYVLKVGANATFDSYSSTTTSCSVHSYNSTGELATVTATGYTQTGIAKTDGTWTRSTHSVNFTNSASTWTAVSSAATFDTIEVYDATCTGCLYSNQLVAIFPITSFTGPTTGTYTVTPPSNMIVLTQDQYGIHWNDVASVSVAGDANIQLPPLFINGRMAL